MSPSEREWGRGVLGTEVRRLARAGESSELGVVLGRGQEVRGRGLMERPRGGLWICGKSGGGD